MGVDGVAQGYASYGTDGGTYERRFATVYETDLPSV